MFNIKKSCPMINIHTLDDKYILNLLKCKTSINTNRPNILMNSLDVTHCLNKTEKILFGIGKGLQTHNLHIIQTPDNIII